MATFRLTASGTFPAGTVVGAYRGDVPLGSLGSAVTSATMGADGVASFAGLAAGASYVAAAQVAGAWRYVRFQTDQEASAADVLAPRQFGFIELYGASIAAGYNALGDEAFPDLLATMLNAQGVYSYAYPNTRSYRQGGPLGMVMETLRREAAAPYPPQGSLGVFAGIYGDIDYTAGSVEPSKSAWRTMIQMFRTAKTFEENDATVTHSSGSRTTLTGGGLQGAGSGTYGSGAYQEIATPGSTTTIAVPSSHHGGAYGLFFAVEPGDAVAATVTVNGTPAAWGDGGTAGALQWSYATVGAESQRVVFCRRLLDVPASAGIVITYTAIAGKARFDRCGIEANPPGVACILDLRKLPTYAGFSAVDDAAVDTWNAMYASLAAEWTDGLVYVAATDALVAKGTTYIDAADNIHLTQRGAALVAAEIVGQMPTLTGAHQAQLARGSLWQAGYGVTLSSPWTAATAGGYQTPTAVLRNGVVRLSGRVQATLGAPSGNSLIFTTPVFARHQSKLEFDVFDDSGNRVRLAVDGTDNVPFGVGTAGGIRHVTGGVANSIISFDGISFRAQR